MKSRMFNKVVRGFVVLGTALAVSNCDDSVNNPTLPTDPNANVEENQGPLPESSADVVDTGDNGAGENLDNGENQFDLTGSSSSAIDEMGNGTEPGNETGSSSSETVVGSSSSVETVGESSSSETLVDDNNIFLANDTDENKNYMEVEYLQQTGWDGKGILAYPRHLSDTKKHAVIVWGPGGGTAPGAYEGMIRRLASHGFVVIALSVSPGDGSQAKAALDWMAEKNNNPTDLLYQKLDLTKVGCSGHSMGGLESERAAVKDDRVITAFLNNSGAWEDPGADKVPAHKSIAILYGEGGMERGNAENDYNRNNVVAPACLIEMTGGTGSECFSYYPGGPEECGWGHGSGSWDGLAATVSWMRWHLGGENFRKADFVGTSGAYINGPIKIWDWQGNMSEKGKWKGQCKNF